MEGITYKNYKYKTILDIESNEDNTKIFHMVITPNEEVIHVDFTPYQKMTSQDLKNYVDLGMPSRDSLDNPCLPLNSSSLQELVEKKTK